MAAPAITGVVIASSFGEGMYFLYAGKWLFRLYERRLRGFQPQQRGDFNL